MAVFYSNIGNQYQLELNLSNNNSNVSNNTSAVPYALYLKSGSRSFTAQASSNMHINGSHVYNLGSSISIGAHSSILLAQGSLQVLHEADGSKTVAFSVGFQTVGQGQIWSCPYLSISGNFTLNTIPRASSISTYSNFQIGNSIPVSINRASTSFTHKLDLQVGNELIYTVSNIATNATITLSEAQIDKLYQLSANSSEMTATLYCTTYSGTVLIGSRTYKNALALVPPDIVPTIGGITHSEANATNPYTKYIKLITRLKIAVTGAVGAKYSTIKSYKLEVDSQVLNAQSGTTQTLESFGIVSLKATVIDSRNRTATKTVDINVLDYSLPSADNLSVKRATETGTISNYGEYALVNAKAVCSSIEDNSLSYEIYSRNSSGGEYEIKYQEDTEFQELDISKLLPEYDRNNGYDFRLIIKDELGQTTYYASIPVGYATMILGNEEVSIGAMPKYGTQYNLEVGEKGMQSDGPIYQNGKQKVLSSSDDSVQDWVTVTRSEFNSLVSNKKIVIGCIYNVID